jgi:hypothetical protein
MSAEEIDADRIANHNLRCKTVAHLLIRARIWNPWTLPVPHTSTAHRHLHFERSKDWRSRLILASVYLHSYGLKERMRRKVEYQVLRSQSISRAGARPEGLLVTINKASDTLVLRAITGAGSHRSQWHSQESIAGTVWLHIIGERSIQLPPIVANKLP